MSDLWIFGRRPSSMVRYRHGGFNATFPMNLHTVIEQVALREAIIAAEEQMAAVEAQRRPDGPAESNVISFSERRTRADRGKHHGGRGQRGPGSLRD